VGVSQARRAALTTAGWAVPDFIQTRAMIDTGASCTCVDASILQQLGIPPTGSVAVRTPSTGTIPHMVNQYDIGFFVLFDNPPKSLYAAQTLAVVESTLAPQGFQALIGRDILATAQFVYNGSAEFYTLSF